MNPISAFFVRNIVLVYFFYGLAFFALGLALTLASRRQSGFRFVEAILPLAAFGVLHGAHEWIEMFQKIAVLTNGYIPSLTAELVRTLILALSFVVLLSFGMILLSPQRPTGLQVAAPLAVMVAVWLAASAMAAWMLHTPPRESIAQADVLARYSLGIPGALLGTWALMRQQRTFREHGMPQFGRDLVWAATALALYGIVGQVFVRQTALVPSDVLNSTAFLRWFGVPVQLFRAVMAIAMAFFVARALSAFEVESQRRLAEAVQARAAAQEAQLAAERHNRQAMEQLNEELRFTARERALLLELANLLVAPLALSDRLRAALEQLVANIRFSNCGLILLRDRSQDRTQTAAQVGFGEAAPAGLFPQAVSLGEHSIRSSQMLCQHSDGAIIALQVESQDKDECQSHPSPMVLLSLPLAVRDQVIGSLVLGRGEAREPLPMAELQLVSAAAQQLGLSLENARLYEEAQAREGLLGRLLRQVVGAQEAERQRIARELHDATGQSLAAISLGLRGVETVLARDGSPAVAPVQELGSYSAQALGELRQIIADLRPSHLDDLGLVPALRWYLQKYSERRGIRTRLLTSGDALRLPAEYETVLFRITQEALTNIAKHAEATQTTVTVSLGEPDIHLTIEDDGRGFDPSTLRQSAALQSATLPGGWGLVGMQERAGLLGGRVVIDSQPDQGTRIHVFIPYPTERQDARQDPVTVS